MPISSAIPIPTRPKKKVSIIFFLIYFFINLLFFFINLLIHSLISHLHYQSRTPPYKKNQPGLVNIPIPARPKKYADFISNPDPTCPKKKVSMFFFLIYFFINFFFYYYY